MPFAPATPALQTSDESDWSGRSMPVHEKPNAEPVQVVMLESAEQPVAIDDVSIQQ